MDLEQDERRGMEAQSVLQNGIYKESYKVIRDNIVSQLSLADTPDDRRKRLNDLLIALGKIEGYLRQVMTTGTMAAIEQERKRSLSDRILRRA
jgi:hypothetical protein